jgi:hypothetical protein
MCDDLGRKAIAMVWRSVSRSGGNGHLVEAYRSSPLSLTTPAPLPRRVSAGLSVMC